MRPTGLNEGTLLVRRVGTAGQKDSLTDGGQSPFQTRCYALFVERDVLGVSPGRDVKARTVTAGAAWAFTTHMSVVTSPGVGPGVIHVVSNDGHLYSVVGGAGGGLWPPGWTPKAFADPSEGRPTSIPLNAGANPVMYLGSGDGGSGGILYAVNPLTGADLYTPAPLAHRVQATPSGIFSEFGGGMDLILAGTRNSSGPSSLYALNPGTGAEVWRYDGEDPGDSGPGYRDHQRSALGRLRRATRLLHQRAVRPHRRHGVVRRSHHRRSAAARPGPHPLSAAWTPAPFPRGTTLYVAPASPGVGVDETVHALSADDGTPIWDWSPTTLDGPVKGFIFPAYGTEDLYFSTGNKVWCGTDTGSELTIKWSTGLGQPVDIPNPSTPVLAVERNEVWVGGGNGRLYRLDATTGAKWATDGEFNLNPGTPLASPTVDRDGGFVYVGGVDGRVFAVPLPVIP